MPSFRISTRRAAIATALACTLGLTGSQARAGDFSFGGKTFADVSQLQQNDHLAHSDSSDTDADLKRLYLDVGYAFDSNWSAQLTTDINWLRGQHEADIWLRHLYLQRKFAGGSISIGVNDMPMMALTSKWYGYRYVDPIGASLAKIDSSADWGVHTQVQLAPGVDMAVAVVSGGGYKEPTTGRRADVEALVAWQPTKHVLLATGGYDGQLAAEDSVGNPLHHTARRFDLMAAYADDTWRFGVRYAYASNWANLYSVRSDRVRNLSTWASMRVAQQWSVLARYDYTESSVLIDPSRKTRYANAGVEWQPCKKLRLALVFKHTAQDRAGNLTRSGNEAGIWSEWTF